MAQKTNFEDNLFYLNALMKALRDGLALEIDPEIFLDKTVDDIFFIDSVLVRTFRTIRENSFMIRRTELLRDVLRSKKQFIELLERILKNEFAFSRNLEPFFQKLTSSKDDHSLDLKEIQALLASPDGQTGETPDVISETELRFLLEEEKEDGGA